MKIHCSFIGNVSKENRAKARNMIYSNKGLSHILLHKHSWKISEYVSACDNMICIMFTKESLDARIFIS